MTEWLTAKLTEITDVLSCINAANVIWVHVPALHLHLQSLFRLVLVDYTNNWWKKTWKGMPEVGFRKIAVKFHNTVLYWYQFYAYFFHFNFFLTTSNLFFIHVHTITWLYVCKIAGKKMLDYIPKKLSMGSFGKLKL